MGRRRLAPSLLVSAVIASTAFGCNIPVFRYALERWPASPYEVFVFHRGPLQPAEREALEQLKRALDARPAPNLECSEVDVAQPLPAEAAELWQSLKDPPVPLLVARYPAVRGAPDVAFSGPLSVANVQALVDSPARREVAKRLLAGESAVWVLLKSGSAAEDEAAARLLGTELKRLEKELQLPEQDPDAGPMARPVADLPLRVAFSTVSVSREDAAERAFVQMLLGGEGGLAGKQGAIAFPVFGRGRALCALKQKDLTADAVTEVGEFVTGACSCQVKDMNPGMDLLLTADWDALLEGRAVEEPAPPALTGLTATAPPAGGTGMSRLPAAAAQAAAAPGRAPAGSRALLRNVLIAAGALILAVAVVTVVLKFRAAGKRN